METSTLNSIFLLVLGSAFSAIVTFMMAQYWWNRNRDTSIAKDIAASAKAVSDRLAMLEAKALMAEQTLTPISTAMQAALIRQLTHDHEPIFDDLLKKIDPFTMTEEEEILFYSMLEERSRNMTPEINASERNAARMLPYIMKRVKEEEDTKGKVGIQTVVVPIKIDPTSLDQSQAPAKVSTVHNNPSADPADPVRPDPAA